jgi:hypothetical protein
MITGFIDLEHIRDYLKYVSQNLFCIPDVTGVPSKAHNRQLVKIQPEERLATTSELNPTPVW